MPEENQNQALLSSEESLPTETESSNEEFIDPGQLEGLGNKPESTQEKKEPTANEPPEGHPRWNKVYAQMKESERKSAELQKQLDEQNALFKDMQEHNQKLAASFETQKVTTEKVNEQKIASDKRSELSKLRAAKRDALKDQDFVRADEISEEMDEIKWEIFSSQIPKQSTPQIDESKLMEKVEQKNIQANTERASNEFVSSTPWFQQNSEDYDSVMSAAAVGLETQLLQQYPDPFIRLREVKRQVEERFNYRGKGTQNTGMFMEPSRPATPRSNGNKVTSLTPEQKRTAQKLLGGIYADPEKAYIAQLNRINEGK
jgi:hypothetical protein